MSASDSSVGRGAAGSPPAPADDAFPAGDFSTAILDQMLNGVAYCRVIFDNGRASDFVYLYTNPAFHHQTGLGPVCGKRVSEVIPGILESDPALIETYGRVAAGGPPEKFEIFIEALKQWFSVQVSSPRPEYFVVAFDVVTQRKQAEAALHESEGRLAAVFQANPIGISVTRVADGKILDLNSAALQMYGYAREEVLGRTVAELGVYVNPAQREEMVRGLRAQGGVDHFPIDFRRKSGEAGLMEVSARVIELQGEHCLVGMMVDVTERKRLQELHLQAQKLEALGTLAGGVAHDFNNIIASIVGNAELARQDVGPGHPALVSLEEIGIASRRAKELVQQILAFGRRHLVERKVIALGPVVQEAASLLRVTLPAGVSLEVVCDPDVPAVLADATQIGQVVLNLGNNAWQSMQAQARYGAIVVRLQNLEQTANRVEDAGTLVVLGELRPGRYACLTVEDNGSGMDAATVSRMFEPFFTTKPVGKGTGLGLAVVHGIAQEHDLSIAVRSVPGEGSVFRVYFPAAQAAGQVEQAMARGVAPAHGQGRHILYVDDDEAIVFLMTRLLERQGYRVSGYTEPRRALAAVRADHGQFDLAVTDYNMPDMSGLAVARALKEIRSDLPIAMASGYITDELRLQAPAAGVSELIYKPNTVEELCEAVARLAKADVTKPAGSA